jgi:hypothetical protein
MSFDFSRLVGPKPQHDEIDVVKRLIRESTSAHDFLQRAMDEGFNPCSENDSGVLMEGKSCYLSYKVLGDQDVLCGHCRKPISELSFVPKCGSGGIPLIENGMRLF